MATGGRKTFNSGNLGTVRQSNALASIQAFQSSNAETMKRASTNLSMTGATGDQAEILIENERLRTTLQILNQKMKIAEDNEDLNEKWKSQVSSKDGQINILKEQIEHLQSD